MIVSKNKLFQYLFFFFIFFISIFNAGNSNIFIQINFLVICSFLFLTLKDKNYFLHFKYFFSKNKFSINFFFFFLTYLLFQLIPIPLEFLKFISFEKYNILQNMNININKSSISLSSSETYFQLLNYLSLFIFILLFKILFYTQRHILRYYYFLSMLGAFHALFAVLLYLNGNPEFFFLKKIFYENVATGFVTNRTVFSIFLILCLISSLEYLKILDINQLLKKKDNFFNKIYVRIFILLITIGIITTFSKLGNFIMIVTILYYLTNHLFSKKTQSKNFTILLFVIIFMDIIILGYFFGGDKLLPRFLFLNDQLSIKEDSLGITRMNLIFFSFENLKNYLLFGYGAGSYDVFFKLNYLNSTTYYADHAHSDILEFLGEFGIFGFILFFLSFIKFFLKKSNYNFQSINLLFIVGIILVFDFSLHIPLIQVLILSLLITNFNSIRSTVR